MCAATTDMVGLAGTFIVPDPEAPVQPCDNFGHQSPKDRLATGAFHGFVEIERYRGPRPGDELVCISTIAANRPAMEGQK